MKKLVAVMLLMTWAALAFAQTTAQDGQSTRQSQQGAFIGGMLDADSTMRVIRASTTGGLKISDESRDRDYVTLFQSAISTASLAAAAAESSSVLSVGAYRYLKLLVKATPIGASVNTTVRLGFQFREHMSANSDSGSVFAEYLYGRSDNGVLAGTTGVDTTFSGHLVTGTVSLPWSGEYVVQINMNRSAPASGVAANVFSYPNGVALSLDSIFGRPARFNQLSIRVRNLNITGPAVKLNVSVLGFAQ